MTKYWLIERECDVFKLLGFYDSVVEIQHTHGRGDQIIEVVDSVPTRMWNLDDEGWQGPEQIALDSDL